MKRRIKLSIPWIVLIVAFSARVEAQTKTIRFHGYDKAIEIKNATTRVILCPQVGGRVLVYSRHGKNALFLDDAEKDWKPGAKIPITAGRFDIGPELVIPRRNVLWSGEWTGEITGKHSARLTSQPDAATGVQLVRDFELAKDSSRLSCKQTIKNVSKAVKEWCHWSRTFATGNGLCLIPVTDHSRFPNKYVMYEEGSLINLKPVDPNIKLRDGFIEITGVPRRPKLGFDSYAGWLAYVTRDNLLFVKRFKTNRDWVYNEAAGLTISIWYPEDRRVELEPIGPRQSLKPGEQASFTEEWWLGDFEFPKGSVDLQALQAVANKLK
jgi:hypothetical protein